MTDQSCRETTIGDCAVINDSTYSPKEQWPFINYLDTGNITTNRVSDIQHLISKQDKVPSRARRKCKPGDIVYSTVRPNQRHFGILKQIPENFLASTGFAVLRGKENIADTDYLYYYLSQDTIAEHSTSAYPSIKPRDIASLELSLPSLDEQRRIAHILGTLDDKIELNRRISQTLETIAQALFKSWFVDFDPVRAKAKGRPPGLPPHLDALFPDKFQDSELGKIPSGWEVGPLGDVCHKPQYGYTQSAQTEPVGPKFLRITDINKQPWIEWESVHHCEITPEDIEKYQLHHGDILIARMADPGHGCMIEDEPNAVFASYLIRFRSIHERNARYLQYWLRSEGYWELVQGRRTGTTRANLNAKALSGFPLVIPPAPILDEFSKRVDSLRTGVVANVEESHSLSVQRDTLVLDLLREPFNEYTDKLGEHG